MTFDEWKAGNEGRMGGEEFARAAWAQCEALVRAALTGAPIEAVAAVNAALAPTVVQVQASDTGTATDAVVQG